MNLTDSLHDLLSSDNAERDRFTAPEPHIQFWTGKGRLKLWSPCTNAIDWTFDEKDLEHGSCSFKLPADDNWTEYFEGLDRYLARLVTFDWPGGYRPAFVLTSYRRVRIGKRTWFEVTGSTLTAYLSAVHLWANPLMPPEVQISGAWRAIGPASTAWKTALTLNLVRLQANTWSIPIRNPFDPGSWDLVRNALHPIMINPRRVGLFDTSGWIMAEWCMETAWDAAVEIAEAQGMSVRCDLWLPGDAQPFPEWMTLAEPRIIVDMVPSARDINFTGTFVDGLIREAIKIADDAFSWITYPLLEPTGIMDRLEDRQKLRIPLYRSGEWSPATQADEVTHLPQATRATVGGKSPGWLNGLVATTVGAGVSAIGAAVGLPGLRIGFLEELAQNRLFAYHSVENLNLAREAGDWRLRERFAGSQTTALSLQAGEAAKSTLHETRGWVSHEIQVANGSPYFLGKHLVLGMPVAVEREDSSIGVDTLTGVSASGGRGATTVTLTVASPEESEPGLYALKKIRKATGWINRLALQN